MADPLNADRAPSAAASILISTEDPSAHSRALVRAVSSMVSQPLAQRRLAIERNSASSSSTRTPSAVMRARTIGSAKISSIDSSGYSTIAISSSVRDRGAAAELDLAQGQRERHGREREQHQDPEDVRYRPGTPPAPAPAGRSRRKPAAAPAASELPCATKYCVTCCSVSWYCDARRNHMLDQPALMELLAVSQHVGGERHADRAAGVARGVDQRRGLSVLSGGMPS